ncbi:MAG: hypothetical protein U0T73_05330 [Chitinophagales bacterium]
MNKAIAGYHLLMILSAVDRKFSAAEDAVIADYIAQNFPIHVPLDRELEVISRLNEDDYMLHFQKAMDDFYEDSTEKERMELIDFAIQLTKATKPITKEENQFLSELYNEWTETVE